MVYENEIIVQNLINETLVGNAIWEYSRNSLSYIFSKKVDGDKTIRFQLIPLDKNYTLSITYTYTKDDYYVTDYIRTFTGEFNELMETIENGNNKK